MIPEDCQTMTPAEVAQALRVSRWTVARMIERGRASRGRAGLWPAYRIGRAVRVSAAAVRALLARGAEPGGAL